jgi:hypothetical protein
MLANLLDRLQWDRSLAYALITRGWQAISGPITIIFLINSLELAEQGIYYTIVGIVGIQAYFELGLLNVLVSQSGHASAAIKQAEVKAIESDTPLDLDPDWLQATARMRDLIRSSFRWFGSAAFIYTLVALLFGWFTLADSETTWRWPLVATVPVAAIAIAFAPALSILEGAGYRDLIYRYRLIQMILGSLAVWLALTSGLKLWALMFASLIQSVISIYVVLVTKRDFFKKMYEIKQVSSRFVWMREVVPVQWRVALISASFHFATQFFTIIICKFHSDKEAAPLGMTLSVTTAIQMLSLAWVQTKYPMVAAHHGSGNRELAGTVWRRTAIISTCLLLLGFSALTLFVSTLPILGRGLEERFITPFQVALLGIGGLANHIAAVQGFYVLAMKAKPLLIASLIGSIPTGLAVWIGGYLYGTDGVLIGYAAGMGLFLAPAHSWAYYQFRKNPQIA